MYIWLKCVGWRGDEPISVPFLTVDYGPSHTSLAIQLEDYEFFNLLNAGVELR